jgi:hypothetical protein
MFHLNPEKMKAELRSEHCRFQIAGRDGQANDVFSGIQPLPQPIAGGSRA